MAKDKKEITTATLSDSIREFAQETRPLTEENKLLAEKNSQLYGQVMDIYQQSTDVIISIAVNNQRIDQLNKVRQEQIDQWLQETADKFARRDEIYYFLKRIESEERFMAFYEGARDRNHLGLESALSKLEEDYLHFKEKKEMRKRSKSKEDCLREEIKKPLHLGIVLQPTENELVQELYIPMPWERRGFGLIGKLNKEIISVIAPNTYMDPGDYKGIAKIIIKEDYQTLKENLEKIEVKEFAEANIGYAVISVRDLMEEKEEVKKKKTFFEGVKKKLLFQKD